jgi:hypothetical protein
LRFGQRPACAAASADANIRLSLAEKIGEAPFAAE